MNRVLSVTLLLVVVATAVATAQVHLDRVTPNAGVDRYLRTLELAGAAETTRLHYRSETTGTWRVREDHPWSGLLSDSMEKPWYADARQFASYNPGYPHGGNDGRLWQGAGVNSATAARVGYRLPFGVIQLSGTFTASQNADYPVLDTSYGDGWGNYRRSPDVPQRFGPDHVIDAGLDGSELMAAYRGIYASVGFRDRWLGPTEHNAIILSTHAAPYFSGAVGLLPTETPIGALEFHADLGITHESDYFDDDPDNDRALNMIASLGYAPSFLPGLTLGIHRQVRGYTDNLAQVLSTMATLDMVAGFGADQLDQRASITFDWTLPRSGFSAYGEWAKNDYSTNWRTIVREPEHSVAYTLGLTQVLRPTDVSLLRLTFELTQLVNSRDYTLGIGGGGTFYSHGRVRQGSTHRGQVLGGAIGSGADSQVLRADWYFPWGRVGGKIQRHARDKDYLYGNPDNYWFVNDGRIAYRRQNVEMAYVLEADYWVGRWLVGAELGYLRNINWNWIEYNDLEGPRLGISVSRSF